jgi:hypothetical protein
MNQLDMVTCRENERAMQLLSIINKKQAGHQHRDTHAGVNHSHSTLFSRFSQRTQYFSQWSRNIYFSSVVHFFIDSLILGEFSRLSSLYILVISPLSDV